MFRGKLLEETAMRVRVWKLLEKTMCKLPSLWAKVCKKDLKMSVRSLETFIWKVRNSVCLAIVCLVTLYLETSGSSLNLSFPQMLYIPYVWPAVCTQVGIENDLFFF